MAKVGIVMGSDSDMPVMAQAADILEKLGVEFEMTIISAHREPDVFFEYARSAEARGYKVIIAGAVSYTHLPDRRRHCEGAGREEMPRALHAHDQGQTGAWRGLWGGGGEDCR